MIAKYFETLTLTVIAALITVFGLSIADEPNAHNRPVDMYSGIVAGLTQR